MLNDNIGPPLDVLIGRFFRRALEARSKCARVTAQLHAASAKAIACPVLVLCPLPPIYIILLFVLLFVVRYVDVFDCFLWCVRQSEGRSRAMVMGAWTGGVDAVTGCLVDTGGRDLERRLTYGTVEVRCRQRVSFGILLLCNRNWYFY